MKARPAEALSLSFVFFGLIIILLEKPVAVNCGTIICGNLATLVGPLTMVGGLIALTVIGLVARDGKII